MIQNRSHFSVFFVLLLLLFIPFFSATENVLHTVFSSGVSDESVFTVQAAQESRHSSEPEHGEGGGHADPFSNILMSLAIVIIAAMVGRWGAGKLNQPSVLGELLIGVLIGNIFYWMGGPVATLVMHMDSAGEIVRMTWQTGMSTFDAAKQVFSTEQLAPGGLGDKLLGILTGHNAPKYILMTISLWIFSSLGVILLLFMVGLESSVEEMMGVGKQALMVAVVGIIAPFALGFGASSLLIPEAPLTTGLFLGATLAATSVGITARVFKDLDKLQTSEAKLILGAAVIDDILGLILLAVVVGIVVTGEFRIGEVIKISLLSVVFLGGLIFIVGRLMNRITGFFARFDRGNLTLLFPLFMAFLVAWSANLIGLATIVGAFAAGLIINEEQFKAYTGPDVHLMKVIAPLEALFAPVFFVLMGMQVNLASFLDSATLWLALAFVVAAIIGKIVSGIVAGRGTDKISVGIGMVPRGEVGLIFASIGKGLGVVTDAVFSAVVIMVIVTTLITPLGLKWSLFRKSQV